MRFILESYLIEVPAAHTIIDGETFVSSRKKKVEVWRAYVIEQAYAGGEAKVTLIFDVSLEDAVESINEYVAQKAEEAVVSNAKRNKSP